MSHADKQTGKLIPLVKSRKLHGHMLATDQ